MNEFVFALEHVLTSQGWFLPGHLLPKHDLPDDEGLQLLADKKVAICAFDSPLAAAVHESRKMDPHAAAVFLKDAAEKLSPQSPEPAEPVSDTEPPESDDWDDPTPEGEFPTLENYLRAGYKPENYEGQKAGFLKDQAMQKAAEAAEKAKQDAANGPSSTEPTE